MEVLDIGYSTFYMILSWVLSGVWGCSFNHVTSLCILLYIEKFPGSFYLYVNFFFLQFAVSSAIITVSTLGTLFEYSDKSVVFMYFFSFGLSAIMLSFLISTFFTRAKTAVAVGTLSFLGAFFPYYTVNDEAVSMLVFMCYY